MRSHPAFAALALGAAMALSGCNSEGGGSSNAPATAAKGGPATP